MKCFKPYRLGSPTAAAKELARCKLDLVGLQKVRRDKEQGIVFFCVEEETRVINLGTGVFVHHRVVSAVKRVEFISDRMLHIILGG
jgi:hypothetical protein